ncbi:ATP-binding protein [Streptomyces sp. NPDC006368]|uniref:ATP-binding protein n=1 Tax=Streptomyces sp. NPDC006368 TaxID=3156760 RepID=UPI0033B585C5
MTVQRRIDLTHSTDAPAQARRIVAAFLAEVERVHGHPSSATTVDAVLLVASELVTNAVRHTPGPCTLSLTLQDQGVLVEVSDTSPALPRPRLPDITGACGGWGWPMIDRLADEVRVTRGPGGGKTVRTRLSW